LLEASYLIGKTMEPHNIGESLILPAAIKIVSVMHLLPRETVSQCITTLSQDIKFHLLDQLSQSPNFTMQLNKSTNVANLAQFLVYV
jgi:hypothetical protein